MHFDPKINILEAYAGYYKARLYERISCELTATTRTGIARLSFDESEYLTLLIGTGINSTEITEASVNITGPSGFEGQADGGSFCGAPSNYTLYFVAEFDTPADESGTWKDSVLNVGSISTKGANSGVYFIFNSSRNSVIQYKVGTRKVQISCW